MKQSFGCVLMLCVDSMQSRMVALLHHSRFVLPHQGRIHDGIAVERCTSMMLNVTIEAARLCLS
jgi:hypothetical protein